MIDSTVYPNIKQFAFLPQRTLDSFRDLTGEHKTSYEVMSRINLDYQEALAEDGMPRIIFKATDKSVVEDMDLAEKVYFITSFDTNNSAGKVVLHFTRNQRPDQQPWELQTVLSENDYNNAAYIDLGNRPKDMLYNFAYWPTFVSDLKFLKDNMALKENWSFEADPDDDSFPILRRYITYTFAKLWWDKGVYISPTEQYAVFNTGLVNRNYQYIYALFERNDGDRPWKFNQFCIPGIKYGGRLLAENFATLPKPAHYFNDISDVVYIISKDRTPDEQLPDLQPDHYFVDHPDRLPMHFLLDACRKSEQIVGLLSTDTSTFSKEELESHWKAIGEAISDDENVYNDLESAFRNAVRKAVMRVSWNYRTAIPVYFPTSKKMSILLPLTFSTTADAEVALVVEKNPISSRYIAPTILNLTMAYSNARLVCKPESDWLNQQFFTKATDDDE